MLPSHRPEWSHNGDGKRSPNGDGLLTHRELAVLRMLADGEDTRGIAAELNYSERTIKNIVRDVLVKLGCRTRAQAVATATRQGAI
jgi:DNA-binding NarL/FixJ family response regulator